MAQPRYNAALQEFIRQWRPNDPELDKRFIDAIRDLLAAALKPPVGAFEVSTILTNVGGKVTLRVADYEAQLDPLDAQHLALGLMEAAVSARTESGLMRFIKENLSQEQNVAAGIIGEFDPLDAQHLVLGLMEAAVSARTESGLMRFIKENLSQEQNVAAGIIGEFRAYQAEEMQRELDGDFERRSVAKP